MNRYPAAASGRRVLTLPRYLVTTLGVAIPAWAQNGRSFLIVTGCAAGQSGNIVVANNGIGGAAGAIAQRYRMLIPAGQATVDVTIGAPGAAVTGTTAAAGLAGGDAIVACGASHLRLRGGGQNIAGSMPIVGNPTLPGTMGQAVITFPPHLVIGASANQNGGGALSPFGSPSPVRFGTGPALNESGGSGVGYGYGGNYARYDNGGAVTSGAGGPSFIDLEIEEGVA